MKELTRVLDPEGKTRKAYLKLKRRPLDPNLILVARHYGFERVKRYFRCDEYYKVKRAIIGQGITEAFRQHMVEALTLLVKEERIQANVAEAK